MFKASIALVLIAFAALAYGWVADNDAILYGSIGASILAGLLLLRATMADRKAYPDPGRSERPERPAREPRESKASRRSEADYAPADSRSRRSDKGRPDSDEMTRQLDVSDDDDDFLGADSEQATPFRPQSRRRQRLPSVPEGAAWADGNEEYGYGESGDETGSRSAARPSYTGKPDQDQDEPQPGAPSPGGASPADDFRSRLAAVLGSTGEESPPPPGPARQTPRPVPLDDDEDDEAPAAAAAARRTRRTASRPEPDAEPQAEAPKRRGRKKASEPPIPAETEPQEAEAGDEAHIDDGPQKSRVIQPGGGFARPDVPEEVTHYRPRRPAVASTPPESAAAEPAKAPAPRKRRSPDAPAVSKVRSADPKPASRQSSGLTRVSPAEKTRSKAAKDRDPDAPPPRRGRPPKPKP